MKPIVRTVPLDVLILDQDNANKGTNRGRELLARSLGKYGAGRSVLVDRKNRVIAGNKTVEAARVAGLQSIAVIETDGSSLVAVQRGGLYIASHNRTVWLLAGFPRLPEEDHSSIARARSNDQAECRDKKASAPSRRRDMSLDIPFYRNFPITVQGAVLYNLEGLFRPRHDC